MSSILYQVSGLKPPNRKYFIIGLIRDPRPLILGVSFGGMIGIEMARQMAIEKLIIISSVKSSSELPRWMRIAGNFQLYKMLPTQSYKWMKKLDNKKLGVSVCIDRQG